MPDKEKMHEVITLLQKLGKACDNILVDTTPLMSQDFIKSSFNDAKARSNSTERIKRWSKETMQIIDTKCQVLFPEVGIESREYSNNSSDFSLNGINSKATVIFQLFHWACVSKTCADSIRELFTKEPTAHQRRNTSIQTTYQWLKCFVINVQMSIRFSTKLLFPESSEANDNTDPSIVSYFTHACFTSQIVHSSSLVFSSFGINPDKISIFKEGNVEIILKTLGISDQPFLKHHLYGLMTTAFRSFLKTNPESKRLVQFPGTFSAFLNLNENHRDYDRTFNIMQFLYCFKEVEEFVKYLDPKDREEETVMNPPVSDTTPVTTNSRRRSTDRSDREILRSMIPSLKNLHPIKTLSSDYTKQEKVYKQVTRKLFTKGNLIKNSSNLWMELVALSKCVDHLVHLHETPGMKPNKDESILIQKLIVHLI